MPKTRWLAMVASHSRSIALVSRPALDVDRVARQLAVADPAPDLVDLRRRREDAGLGPGLDRPAEDAVRRQPQRPLVGRGIAGEEGAVGADQARREGEAAAEAGVKALISRGSTDTAATPAKPPSG